MALTYLQVTNIVLREVNEVPMSEQQFINARGLQQFAKQAVNRAYLEITNSSREWPWLRAETSTGKASVTLRTNSQENNIDRSSFSHVDWDTFYLTEKDLSVGAPDSDNPGEPVDTSPRELSINLERIDYDEWVRKYREDDLREDHEGGVPKYVFMLPNRDAFGLSPKPDKLYTVQYNAWNVPTFLTEPTDVLPFPERWYPVLVSRARYYMWLFRENDRQASFAKGDYETGLAEMKRELLGQQFNDVRFI